MSAKQLLRTVLDVAASPLTLVSAAWLRLVRTAGLQRSPVSAAIFRAVGIYPLRKHYYEPLFDFPDELWSKPRPLPGIDFNVPAQLELIRSFKHAEELKALPLESASELQFSYHNPSFGPGDSEFYYLLLRHLKPRLIVEIGSGHSTLLALAALEKNKAEGEECEITCIEPYEIGWLEKLPVKLVRKRVEEVENALFSQLKAGDILFIDSSHMIRPGGDVLFELLQLLPSLPSGVYVHIHDIFTPREYPKEWLQGRFRFWNEQYLLEAFLTNNREFEVVCSLNHLWNCERAEVAPQLPVLAAEPHRQPGSFWIRKV